MRFQYDRKHDQQLDDSQGYAQTLQALLADPRLNELNYQDPISEEAAAVVLMLAQTLGYCRLFAVSVPETLDGSLPCTAAVSAAMTLKGIMADCVSEVEEFAVQFHSTRTDVEAELLAADWLRVRMDIWATFLAIEEGWRAAMEAGDVRADQLSDAMDELLDDIHQLDVALQRDLDLLSIVEQTMLLQNWRDMLSEDFSHGLPWWLDGTIGKMAATLRSGGNRVAGEMASSQADRMVEQVRRFRCLQSWTQSNTSDAPTESRDEVFQWTSPEGTWIATLEMLKSRKEEGRTMCRVVFSGANQEQLDGVLLSLGTARAIVRLELTGETDSAVPPYAIADLPIEALKMEEMEFALRVSGHLWRETGGQS